MLHKLVLTADAALVPAMMQTGDGLAAPLDPFAMKQTASEGGPLGDYPNDRDGVDVPAMTKYDDGSADAVARTRDVAPWNCFRHFYSGTF